MQTASGWHAVKGSFERLGPELQLRVNAPTIFRGLSFTANYSYLASLQGPSGHSSLLKLDLTLALFSDPELSQKVSLNFDYTRGGLDFTKQPVNTSTVGLSLLY
jgi:hypothetical protein